MPFFGVPIRNGLPIGLGSVAGFGVQQFDPLELFASGANGVWYDPSDTSTLFQDPAGTTPVTAVEQPVGLMLDKSKGLVLGPDVVVNGTFDSDSGWTKGTSWTISGGTANAGGTGSSLTQSITLVANTLYQVKYTIASISSGNIKVQFQGGSAVVGTIRSVAGTYTEYINSGNNTTIAFVSGGTAPDAKIDNISARELPGNHAISYNSTTARPTLSARVNQLTYSEQFDNAAWTKTALNTTGTPPWVNVAIAPDGTTTAEKLIATSVTSAHFANQAVTLVASTNYTTSVYVKAAEYGWAIVYIGTIGVGRYINLSSGAVGSVFIGAPTATTVTDAGNGWWRVSMVFNSGANTSGDVRVYATTADATSSYLGDGTSGILVWGADLRPANIGSAVPSYQRIAAATDYDTNGFPKYLYFAGVDDGMSTPANLDLTSTDKVAVFSGVRKLSDAVAGVLTELSAAVASNNGAFAIVAPTAVAANSYNWASRGTLGVDNAVVNAFTAPVTGVITGIADIAAPISTNRLSGAVLQTLTTSQGTGNYGSYPLYIGARNNASAWFNGYLYGLTVVGAQLTTPQIESMETWTAQRTGITL